VVTEVLRVTGYDTLSNPQFAEEEVMCGFGGRITTAGKLSAMDCWPAILALSD